MNVWPAISGLLLASSVQILSAPPMPPMAPSNPLLVTNTYFLTTQMQASYWHEPALHVWMPFVPSGQSQDCDVPGLQPPWVQVPQPQLLVQLCVPRLQ